MEDEGALCRNCQTELVGPYCHDCGQRAHDGIVALRPFLAEVAQELSSFESRILATLRTLLLSPGALTSAYVGGRRSAFVSPIRLYLLTSVAFATAGVFSQASLVISMDQGNPDRAMWLRFWVWSVLVMMPVFAGLLKATVGRGRFFTEHLVFALHLHAFVFLLNAVALPIVEVSSVGWLDGVIVLSLPILIVIYLTSAIRHFYGTSTRRAIVSAVGLAGVYLAIQLAAVGAVGAMLSGFGA